MSRVPLRDRLRAAPVHGLLSSNAEPQVVEVAGLLGFGLYILDTEHGTAGPREAEEVARACEVSGMAPLVRPRGLDPKLILQYLDAGMEGIMLPGVRTVEEVRQLVAAVRYPPLGLRGINAVRANRWFLAGESQEAWIGRANAETLVLPQIETLEALERVSEMAKVPGVDGFIIGPRDLSLAMGFADGPGHPEVEDALERITRTALGAGLLVGTVAPTGERAKALAAKGHRILLHSINGLLRAGAEAYFRTARG